MRSRVLFVLLLLAGSAAAQLNASTTIQRVRVQVAFVNGVCDVSTHVSLLGRSGLLAEAVPNNQCTVEFTNIPEGTYHLSVSGVHSGDMDAGSVTVTAGGSTDFEIKVSSRNQPDQAAPIGSAFLSLNELSVPAAARKQFDKANELIARQDLSKAKDRLNQALSIYPAYASAYNSLGVIYARQGDRTQEREALERAIRIDARFAPAYVNLGRMNIGMGDFASAQTALNRASDLDPNESMTLVLLTYAQFMDHRLDEAIATCKRAHMLSGSHAFVHQIAARAFEQKHDATNAIAQLKEFLKEEPTGARADAARKELSAAEAIPH